ncbi:MAG: hypothetical protein ACLFV3_01555 [Phycisphaeraceae bacterium]
MHQPDRMNAARQEGQEMSETEALRRAWLWWLVFLLTPFVAFIAVIWTLVYTQWPEREGVANAFFVASLAWMLVAVPGAFLLRGHVFKAYGEGRPVDPRSYVRGMVTIWLAPEIGGLIALAGCLVSHSLMPCLLPAAVAFVLFMPFWPTGHAMTEPVGDVADDEVYRHPR